jgi:hypothetical protein
MINPFAFAGADHPPAIRKSASSRDSPLEQAGFEIPVPL